MKCNTCQNEDYCYDGNHEILRLECKEKDWCCFVPITNADRIRQMTDEGIEDWYWWMHKEMMRYTNSRIFVHEWLKATVEEADK